MNYGYLTRGRIGVDPRDFEYAVVSTVSAARSTEIRELAVVRIDGNGYVLGEYSTTLSSPSNHTPAHSGKPVFADIAAELLQWFDGAIIVGHDLPTIDRLIQAEYERCDIELPDLPGLCTLVAARQQLDLARYRLPDVALATLGRWPASRGSALANARTTANIIMTLITGTPQPLLMSTPQLCELPFITTSGSPRSIAHIAPLNQITTGWLATLSARLPMDFATPMHDPQLYRETLAQTLREPITLESIEVLAEAAQVSGMTYPTICEIHAEVLAELIPEDLTYSAYRELTLAASSPTDPMHISDLDLAAEQRRPRRGNLRGWRLLAADLTHDAMELVEWALVQGASASSIIGEGVSLVVAADDSSDPRVRQAQQHNIPVMNVKQAQQMLEEAAVSRQSPPANVTAGSYVNALINQELNPLSALAKQWRPYELHPDLCQAGSTWGAISWDIDDQDSGVGHDQSQHELETVATTETQTQSEAVSKPVSIPGTGPEIETPSRPEPTHGTPPLQVISLSESELAEYSESNDHAESGEPAEPAERAKQTPTVYTSILPESHASSADILKGPRRAAPRWYNNRKLLAGAAATGIGSAAAVSLIVVGVMQLLSSPPPKTASNTAPAALRSANSANPTLTATVPATTASSTHTAVATPTTSATTTAVYYANCTQMRADGVAPLRKNKPGYRKALDTDLDGYACERTQP